MQLSNNRLANTPSPPGDPAAFMTPAESRQFAQCVENINVLNLRLKNADERCLALREELRRARQVRQASGFRALYILQGHLRPSKTMYIYDGACSYGEPLGETN